MPATMQLGQLGAMNAQAAILFPWLTYLNSKDNQTFGENGETGTDLAMPMHTPITSLTDGVVVGAGYYGGGGVVAISSQVMGRVRSVYYQHLDLNQVAVGDKITTGQEIGLSGGQLSGGLHPAQLEFSTGPHIEVGLDAPYGGMWAPQGPNVNPIPWLVSIYTSGPQSPALGWLAQLLQMVGAQAGATTGAPPTATIGQVPGFLPVAEMIEDAEHWAGFDITNPFGSTLGGIEAFSIRAVIVLVGAAMLLMVLVNLVKGTNEAFGGLPGDVAKGAATAGMVAPI